MALKIYGLGCKLYVKEKFNIFDATIVLAGYLELFLLGNYGLTTLRAIRLLRLFKLAKSWKNLRQLITTLMNSFASVSALGLLLWLMIFIYALIGMQLFGGKIKNSALRPNFDNFFTATIAVFQILTGENWNESMYYVGDEVGKPTIAYFLSLMVIGNFILLNLFVAILLQYLSDKSKEDDEEEELEEEEVNSPEEGGVVGVGGNMDNKPPSPQTRTVQDKDERGGSAEAKGSLLIPTSLVHEDDSIKTIKPKELQKLELEVRNKFQSFRGKPGMGSSSFTPEGKAYQGTTSLTSKRTGINIYGPAGTAVASEYQLRTQGSLKIYIIPPIRRRYKGSGTGYIRGRKRVFAGFEG